MGEDMRKQADAAFSNKVNLLLYNDQKGQFI
jgi:hypothetical protein